MSSPTLIILGITGHKRAGKDTLAEIIGAHEGPARYAVADPLKSAVKQMFGFTDREMDQDKEKVVPRLGISAREALQKIGTDVVRKQFPVLFPTLKPRNLWLLHMEERFRKHVSTVKSEETKENTVLVISDVRFNDEANLIRKYGGKIIRIYRKSADAKVDAHTSEREVDSIKHDFSLHNNGSIEDLEKQVVSLLPKWKSLGTN